MIKDFLKSWGFPMLVVLAAFMGAIYFMVAERTDAGTVKNGVLTINAYNAKKMMDEEPGVIILDVRRPDEYKDGHIRNAILLPLDDIESKAPQLLPDKDKKIMVYCRTGRRSKKAAAKLVQLGYTNVVDFGGIVDWSYDKVKE